MPDDAWQESYIFKLMCEGGVIGDTVFNVVTNKLILFKNGTAPLTYNDVCPVCS